MTMKKRILWLAAILTICGAAMFTACSEYDNPAGGFNGPTTLVGYWYDEYETDGVLPTGETFTKVVQYAAIAALTLGDSDVKKHLLIKKPPFLNL